MKTDLRIKHPLATKNGPWIVAMYLAVDDALSKGIKFFTDKNKCLQTADEVLDIIIKNKKVIVKKAKGSAR